MKYILTILFTSILCGLGFGQCNHPDDIAALTAIYTAMDGPNWTLSNSNSSNKWEPNCNSCDVCRWVGVSDEDGDGRVDNLLLSDFELKGSLPPEISDLTDLKLFNILDNSGIMDITGPLPQSIELLTELEAFVIFNVGFTGPLPNIFGNKDNLFSINIIETNMSGMLDPAVFSSISSSAELQFLNLNNNNFSGPLPEEIGNFPTLEQLFLRNNNFIGCFPVSMLTYCSTTSVLVDNGNNFDALWDDFCANGSGACNCTNDITPPTLNCPISLIPLELDANGLASAIQSDFNITATDDCTAQVQITGGNFNMDCSHVLGFGIYQTIVATDDNGNTAQCQVGVEVTDPFDYCNTNCCGDAKIIGSITEEGGGVLKEVDGVRLLMSTTLFGAAPYAVISKLDNNNDVVWSRMITEESQFLDFTINSDGNILIIGRTTPVSVGQTNECIMGIINSNTGAVISMKKHEFFGRQTFSKILRHDNPKNTTFPYYILGIENGSTSNTNANDDVILLNVGEQLQVNWSNKYVRGNDNQWTRDIIGLANGDLLLIGDQDGVSAALANIDGNTGDILNYFETSDNRSFYEIIEVSGGNFVSAGRSGGPSQNRGMLCYHDSSLSARDVIYIDGAVQFFHSIIETSPGTFIAAGSMLTGKTLFVEFTIPTGTIQIQNIKYLDHDGDAASRANISYANGKLQYSESVMNHPMQFGGVDLFYASLNSDLSDDCFVDVSFPTVTDAFILSSQTVIKDALSVDAGQNMAIAIFDYDLNDACQTVSNLEVEELEVKVYPNPSSGIFTIELDQFSDVTISVFDFTGRQVTRSTPLENKMTIDLSNQTSGLYLLRVRDSIGSISTHKLIITQ